MLYDPFSESSCVDFHFHLDWGESRVRERGIAQVAKPAAFLLQDYLSHLPPCEMFCDLPQNLLEQRCSIHEGALDGKWSSSVRISPAG